jgi:hypothetical protein
MSTTQEEGAVHDTSWSVKIGISRGLEPKWAGNRNAGVLSRNADNSLTLNTARDFPGILWLALVAIAAGFLIVHAVFTGHARCGVDIAGLIAAFVVGLSVIWWRPRVSRLDLRTTVSDVVVDDGQCRIAILARIKEESSWIVLSDFEGRFSEASTAIHAAMGAKCRTGQIPEQNWLPLIIVFAAIVICFIVFGLAVLVPV